MTGRSALATRGLLAGRRIYLLTSFFVNAGAQNADERQIAVAFGEVQTVTDDKIIRDLERELRLAILESRAVSSGLRSDVHDHIEAEIDSIPPGNPITRE